MQRLKISFILELVKMLSSTKCWRGIGLQKIIDTNSPMRSIVIDEDEG